MKDGNEGHGMNKKYEKFKLAVGTTFAFFILVAVMGIAFVQNRYADENILEDELLEIQGDEKFHYVETGITYWQYKDTEGEPSIDSNGKRWNEADSQHCKSRRAGKRLETGTANLAPPALQISHLWLCKCRRAAI